MYLFHNMIEQLHDDGLFPKKKATIKNFDNIQLLDRKFPLHSFSAPHKWECWNQRRFMLIWYCTWSHETQLKELCNVGVTRSQIASILNHMCEGYKFKQAETQKRFPWGFEWCFQGHNYSGNIRATIRWQQIGVSGRWGVCNSWAKLYTLQGDLFPQAYPVHQNLLLLLQSAIVKPKGNSAEKLSALLLVQQFVTVCRLQGAGWEVCTPRCIKLYAKKLVEMQKIKAPTQTLRTPPMWA